MNITKYLPYGSLYYFSKEEERRTGTKNLKYDFSKKEDRIAVLKGAPI
jgi:hypothetical protein